MFGGNSMEEYIRKAMCIVRHKVLNYLWDEFKQGTDDVWEAKNCLIGMELPLKKQARLAHEDFGVGRYEPKHIIAIYIAIDNVIEVAMLELFKHGYSGMIRYLDNGTID